MLLYTLLDEEIAGNAADAMGLTDALGFRPSRICVPLDACSLGASWTRMATASPMVGDHIEVLLVDDVDAVAVDAVCLRRALARASRDDDPEPDPDIVRGMLEPTGLACTDYALHERFNMGMRLRMGTSALSSGDACGYATNPDVRQAIRKAASGVASLATGEASLRALLLLTGVAPFVWAQATRTDLHPDILSANIFDLPDTEGARRALKARRGSFGEHADREAYLATQTAFMEGLDELAHLLAKRRAGRSQTTDNVSCFCGSGIPYEQCCKVKSLNEIARDW